MIETNDPREQYANWHTPEANQENNSTEAKHLPKKEIFEDLGSQQEYNAIDKEEFQYHTDLAEALKSNFKYRRDELPKDIQSEFNTRFNNLTNKIETYNRHWRELTGKSGK